MSGSAKAIFVGINYENVRGCQNLEGLPFVYTKSMINALTVSQSIYKKEECLLFTDSDRDIPGITKGEPTREKVTQALTGMISAAKKGDTLLFYFCGHGANEKQNSRGALKTLNNQLNGPDVLYSDKLDDILQNLSPDISITFLVHACFSGAMFSYHPEKMRGVALTSVGPEIPSVVRKEPDAEDFTTYIRDKVIKELSRSKPTYEAVFEGVKTIVVKGETPSGQKFVGHAELYSAPGVDPTKVKFLQPY